MVAFALEGGGYGDIPSLNWYLVEGAHAVGELGMIMALVGLHRYQTQVYGRLGSVGFWASFGGLVALFFATVLFMPLVASQGELPDEMTVAGALFGVGLLGLVIGFPLLGVATIRSKLLPGWVGWLLVGFVPVLLGVVALEAPGFGGIIVGSLWLLMAYGLWSQQDAWDAQEADA